MDSRRTVKVDLHLLKVAAPNTVLVLPCMEYIKLAAGTLSNKGAPSPPSFSPAWKSPFPFSITISLSTLLPSCRGYQNSLHGSGQDLAVTFSHAVISLPLLSARLRGPQHFVFSTSGETVSTSAFLACHQRYCAGSSLVWGLNLCALVCGIY